MVNVVPVADERRMSAQIRVGYIQEESSFKGKISYIYFTVMVVSHVHAQHTDTFECWINLLFSHFLNI